MKYISSQKNKENYNKLTTNNIFGYKLHSFRLKNSTFLLTSASFSSKIWSLFMSSFSTFLRVERNYNILSRKLVISHDRDPKQNITLHFGETHLLKITYIYHFSD